MVVSTPLIRPYLIILGGCLFFGEGIFDLTRLGYIMKIKYLWHIGKSAPYSEINCYEMVELPLKEIPYVCIYYIHIWTTQWVFPTPCCRHWHKSGARTTSLSISFHTLSGPTITPSGYDVTSNIFVQMGASMQNMDATNFFESNKLVGWIVGSQVTYFVGVVGPEAPSKPKESYFAFAVLISGTIFGQRKTTMYYLFLSLIIRHCQPHLLVYHLALWAPNMWYIDVRNRPCNHNCRSSPLKNDTLEAKNIHPWSLINMEPKINPWKSRFLLETIIFRFHG